MYCRMVDKKFTDTRSLFKFVDHIPWKHSSAIEQEILNNFLLDAGSMRRSSLPGSSTKVPVIVNFNVNPTFEDSDEVIVSDEVTVSDSTAEVMPKPGK